jgi:hypothetical protein
LDEAESLVDLPGPKVVPIKVSGGDEKRGPGRPKGSGTKKKDDDDLDFDPFSLFLPVGMTALAQYLVTKRGAHWSGFADGAEGLGEKLARYLNKKFPGMKAIKYSDEAAILTEIAKVAGPALMVEAMMILNKPDEVKKDGPDGKQPAAAGSSGAVPQPSRPAPAERSQVKSDVAHGVRDVVPLLV